VALPRDELIFLEPEVDFGVGGLHGVRAVDDVTADIDAKVASDGAWGRVARVGLAEHDPTGLDNVQTLPDHRKNRPGSHVSRSQE